MNISDLLKLEALVDKYGLIDVQEALTTITQEKAQHLEEAWQDYGNAKVYYSAASKIGGLASKLRNLGVA